MFYYYELHNNKVPLSETLETAKALHLDVFHLEQRVGLSIDSQMTVSLVKFLKKRKYV